MFDQEQDSSFYDLFVPLSTRKAIHFIVIIGLVVYFNCLFNGFVLDDKTFILFNQEIHSMNFIHIFGPSLFNTGYYRPIPAFYFTILFLLFRDTIFFYHFLQVGIHIVNSLLLLVLFNKFFSKKIALFLSIIFLIHPIQVESVSYIASSGNELFFLFGMIALLLSTKSGMSIVRLVSIFILLLGSFLSRETGFLFLITILLYYLIFNKKRKLQISFFGGLIVSFIYLILRFAIGHVLLTKFEFVPIARLSLAERIVNIPAIILYYLKTFFFPLVLVSQQQWVVRMLNINNFYFPLFADVIFFFAVGFLGMHIYRKHNKYVKEYIFFFTWLVIGFLPQIQIFPLDMTVADRWFYFSIVGLLGLIGISMQIFKPQHKNLQRAGYVLSIGIIAILATRTMIRNSDWTDSLTLDLHDSKIQTNYELEDNLGFDYDSSGNYKEALVHYTASINLYADDGNLHNLGRVYDIIGDKQKAIEYYSKAVSTKHIQPKIHEEIMQATYPRLALLLFKRGSVLKSKDVIKQGLQQYPQLGTLWIELAICEYTLHNQQQALTAAKKGEMLSPNNLSTYVYKQISNQLPININYIN